MPIKIEMMAKASQAIPAKVKDGKLSFTASVAGSQGARMLYEIAWKD